MNLVINASEAIGDKEGSIWVSTGMVHGAKKIFQGTTVTGQPEERDYVFLEISDTGCGMSEETKNKIFDPFFTTKFTGRGLGLAAVLGIVRSHGGTLELESRLGEGTTFTLLFPKADLAGDAKRGEEDSQPIPHWSGEGLALVVDDEESVRTLTSKMLESFEFAVITAVDGRDGMEKFNAHAEAITAVLLDVTMPSMSGLEVFDRIRAIRPDVPILFMSGYMREGELRKLGGATDFLQKPFKLEDLQEKLRLLLDTHAET
jgi:CheY-like chemotaxis protein